MIRAFVLLAVLALMGCSISVGGICEPEGPHPHVNAAVAVRAGPVEVLHATVANARPITDLTVLTLNKGIHLGPLEPSIGVGWQVGRTWGACDSTGHACKHTYPNGYALAAGLTYRQAPLRVDLKAFSFDNSPVGARTSLPLGIEALVLLFGFDL